jgi:hypothetical protein
LPAFLYPIGNAFTKPDKSPSSARGEGLLSETFMAGRIPNQEIITCRYQSLLTAPVPQ